MMMLGQFGSLNQITDAIKISQDINPDPSIKRLPYLRFAGGGQCVELTGKEARLWSLGELAVVLARLAKVGIMQDAWNKESRSIAQLILEKLSSSSPEARFPRHVMHALHGLAACLSTWNYAAKKKADKNS